MVLTIDYRHALYTLKKTGDSLRFKNSKMAERQQKQKILRRGGKNTQKNYTKKIFMTQIIMMV